MTRFQISNEPHGYVVEVLWPDQDGCERWLPLRNFGDRQGDAIDFKNIDCPHLTSQMINALVRRYDKHQRYMRFEEGRYFRLKKT